MSISIEEDSGSLCMFIYLCFIFFRYIFNTEGHFLPMSPEISLPAELCNYAGSFCRERIVGRLGDAKSKLMKELEDSRKAEEKSNNSDLDSQTCSITQSDRDRSGTGDSDGTVPTGSSLKVRIRSISSRLLLFNPCKIW